MSTENNMPHWAVILLTVYAVVVSAALLFVVGVHLLGLARIVS